MSYTVTLTNPLGTVTATLTIPTIDIGGEIDEPAATSFNILERCELYWNQRDSLNAVQVNSLCEIWRGSTRIFKGFVDTVTLNQASGGVKSVSVSCTDPIAKLNNTVAGNSTGVTIAGKIASSPTQTVGAAAADIDLYPLNSSTDPFGSFPQMNMLFYPDGTSSRAWYARSGLPNCPRTTLDGALADHDVTATTNTTDDNGFPPFGIATTSTGGSVECFAYAGYDLNAAGAARVFKLMVRGCLGTAAIALNDGSTIDQMRPCQISDSVVPTLWGWESGEGKSDLPIDPSNYTVLYDEGAFQFTVNPLTTALDPPCLFAGLAVTPEKIVANYSVVAESEANVIIVGGDDTYGGIERLLASDAAADGACGPGLSSSDWDVDMRRLVLPYVYLNGPTSTRSAIEGLLDAAQETCGTRAGVTHYSINYWYNASTAKFCFQALTQAAVGTVLAGMTPVSIRIDSSSSDAISGIVATWQDWIAGDAINQPVVLLNSYSDSDDYAYVFNTDEYNKLINVAMPCHKVSFRNYGITIGYGAVATARRELERSLLIGEVRSYTFRATDLTIPILGDTVTTMDGFTGVVIGWHIGVGNDGVEELSLKICDFTAGLA